MCEDHTSSEYLEDFDKPLKRVRFSDDPCVFLYVPEEENANENLTLENENNENSQLPNAKNNEFSETKLMEAADDYDVTCLSNVISCDKCMYDEQEISSNNSCHVDCVKRQHTCDSSQSAPEDNIKSDVNDLSDLIRNTEVMSITSPAKVETVASHLSSEKCDEDSSDVGNLQNQLQVTKQGGIQNSLRRKRSSADAFIEKQTTQLNMCLRNNKSNISTAENLRNTIYNAWSSVKSESVKNELTKIMPHEKTLKSPVLAERIIKKGVPRKRVARKLIFDKIEPESQKKNEDIEEGKMAFRAWKKRKDELLNQQIAEKRKKEEKERLDTLMSEQIRKKDAESAYLAWIAYKASVFKKERKKKLWFLEKEKVKIKEKEKRNDEAALIYYNWLKSKICSKDYDYCITEDKPPWTPPGKANNLI